MEWASGRMLSMQKAVKVTGVFLGGILIGVAITFVGMSAGWRLPLTGQLTSGYDPFFTGVASMCRVVTEGSCMGTADEENDPDGVFISSGPAQNCFTHNQNMHCNTTDNLDVEFTSNIGCSPQGNATCTGWGPWKLCSKSCAWRCRAIPKNCCGNNLKESSEQCDAGTLLPSSTCRMDCTTVQCGDGRVDNNGTPTSSPSPPSNEECDRGSKCDGNGDVCTTNGDCPFGTCKARTDDPLCTASCTMIRCGDGKVEGTEDCDDGKETAACDVNCTGVECGDGDLNKTAGEECEPGGKSCDDGSFCINDSGCIGGGGCKIHDTFTCTASCKMKAPPISMPDMPPPPAEEIDIPYPTF